MARRSIRVTVTTLVTMLLVASWLALLLLGIGPFTHKYRLLTVRSGSMAPTLPVGSVVVVTPQPLASVQVGDILTFDMPGQKGALETHRVVQVVEAGDQPLVMTKGDANADPDPWRLRLVEGPAWRVRMAVPHLGYALLWWRQPIVRTLSLIVAPLLVAYIWIREIWRRQPDVGIP